MPARATTRTPGARNPARAARAPERPPYAVPTMDEIRALPANGYTVASTFAGGGGSSTGYRMAGYRVLYANEFVDAARATYEANKAPHTITDGRDIRNVTAAEVLDRIGLEPGQLDVLDGSPPCASFSTAGSRSKGWGTVKKYSDTAQRTDDLFYEYARLVDGVRPKVFVAENVTGLVKGSAKGYFLAILGALKACGYRVSARVVDASWVGVPQARQRLIFVGVREDLAKDPVHPAPFTYRHTLADVLDPDHLATDDATDPETGARIGLAGTALGREAITLTEGQTSERYFSLSRSAYDRPSPTITATGGSHPGTAGVIHPNGLRKFTLAELRSISGFPPDYVLTGTYAQRWERMGRSVPPLMMKAVASTVAKEILQ